MSVRPYTVLLGHVFRAGPALVLLATTAEGMTTVVRDLVVVCYGTLEQPFVLYWSQAGSNYELFHRTIPAGPSFHEEMRQVVPPGCDLTITGGGDYWSALVTGYEFAGTPAQPATAGTDIVISTLPGP